MASTVPFTKMHGAGNDFVIIDNRADEYRIDNKAAAKIAERRFGIGCDQLVVMEKSAEADVKMVIFNADGGEAEQCGNGQRAIAHFLHRSGLAVNDLTLTGLGGEVHLKFVDEDQISVTFYQNVSVEEVTIAGVDGYFVDIGNPHWVYHEPDLTAKDMVPLSHIANNYFKSGVNFEAIKKINDHHIQLRVIERGVGETQACGSGACAAAIASATLLGTTTPLTVSMLGGDLRVSYDSDSDKVTLTGPARLVYKGQLNYE